MVSLVSLSFADQPRAACCVFLSTKQHFNNTVISILAVAGKLNAIIYQAQIMLFIETV